MLRLDSYQAHEGVTGEARDCCRWVEGLLVTRNRVGRRHHSDKSSRCFSGLSVQMLPSPNSEQAVLEERALLRSSIDALKAGNAQSVPRERERQKQILAG